MLWLACLGYRRLSRDIVQLKEVIGELLMLPPLLMLLGGCVFIAPAIIINSRMALWQIWLKGVLFISLAHFLGSAIILTAIPPEQFGGGGFSHPIFIGPFMIAALPLVVFMKVTFIAYLGGFRFLFYLLNSVLWSIPITGICYLKRRKQDRDAKERHDKIEDAIARITEDGVVEGPKGPYAPHKRWSTGTPHDTKPIKARSYDGGPWPD